METPAKDTTTTNPNPRLECPGGNVHLQYSLSPTNLNKCDNLQSTQRSAASSNLKSCSSDYVPFVGQVFDSYEDAKMAYFEYAGRMGFNVRKGSTKTVNGLLVLRRFLCCKEGYPNTNKKASKPRKRKIRVSSIVRCGCEAMIRISRVDLSDNWKVGLFVEKHNHDLVTPLKKHSLHSNHEIPSRCRELFQNLNDSHVGPSKQLSIDDAVLGGYETISFTMQDFSNMHKDDHAVVCHHDINLVVEKFESYKEKNDDFFYSILCSDVGQMNGIFWADHVSISDYQLFGQAVMFDTIYETNKYHLTLALFTGVNHHKSLVIFAAAFISKENTEAFVWVLRTFLECMGRTPETIITDQNATMKVAISTTLPNTFHRLCEWQITKKMNDKIGNVYQNKKAMDDFYDLLNNSTSTIEFEDRWATWIEENRLGSNVWLKDIYDIRFNWCSVYMRNHFFAGMSTTQRNEEMNNIFKIKIKSYYTLLEFVYNYESVLKDMREKENLLDHRDKFSPPALVTCLPIERSLFGLYTYEAFSDFQNEVCNSMKHVIRIVSEFEFEVRNLIGFKIDAVVSFIGTSDVPSCSCHMFNFLRIPCCHLIAFFNHRGVMELPSEFVVDRWRISSKPRNRSKICIDEEVHRRHVQNMCEDIVDIAEKSGKDIEEVVKRITENLEGFTKRGQIGGSTSTPLSSISRSTQPGIGRVRIPNPTKARTKGCGQGRQLPKSSSQFRSSGEIVVAKVLSSKLEKCAMCGVIGHNCQSCKKVGSASPIVDKEMITNGQEVDQDFVGGE